MSALDASAGVDDGADRRSRSSVSLLVFVVGYNLAHHNGLIGSADAGGGTRIADWIDLLTPFVVVLPLSCFLWFSEVGPKAWLLAAIGSILYVEGHGIHLSANSISNVVADSVAVRSTDDAARLEDVVHLWDEVVGHYVWYAGLAVLVAVCAFSCRGRRLAVPTSASVIGGSVSGVTWATNGLEGGTAAASLTAAIVALVWAVRTDGGLRMALGAASVVAAVILGVYGIVHSGFPQPSSL